MAEVNKHGLSRYIPAKVRREVRRRSKFGCVICRRGFYQYEHIDPSFEDARGHNPDSICCLCGACHDSVTRGHLSKKAIKAAYRKIQQLAPENADPPIGPLDFHAGNAELLIGGLLYSPAVRNVLRYHGQEIIRVLPSGRADEPGKIFAIFTDDNGTEALRLEENEWVGSLTNWDLDISGQQITVRRGNGIITLQLRLDPPGRIIVERLDMRIADSHILVTDKTYAVGRYITDESVHWVHAQIYIRKSSRFGVAIEFAEPIFLEERDLRFRHTGKELATKDRIVVMNSNGGILVKPLGIAIATLCGAFDLAEVAVGRQNLSDMRQIIVTHPEEIGRFISTGKIGE